MKRINATASHLQVRYFEFNLNFVYLYRGLESVTFRPKDPGLLYKDQPENALKFKMPKWEIYQQRI